MKKILLAVITLLLFVSHKSDAQLVEIDYSRLASRQQLNDINDKRLEILNKGLIDFFTNGKMQGTAQLMKLNIGEPGGFYIPLYLLVGASGNGLGAEKRNENTIANLLNPVGGIFNLTANGMHNLYAKPDKITSLKLNYQLSGKFINGQDSLSGESEFLGIGYVNAGLFFQTGAWDPNEAGNMGVFWIQAKATASLAFDDAVLKSVFGQSITSRFFYGYAVDLGLEINNRINLKAGVYQYLNNQSIDLLQKPIIKLSLDYILKK